RVAARLLQADGRRRDARGFNECPVRGVLGALLDPRLEPGDLVRGESLAGLGRRHPAVLVARLADPLDERTLGRLAGDDRPLLDGRGPVVEPELALLNGRTVALEAGVREDRADVTGEIDFLRGRRRGRREQRERNRESEAGTR